LLSSHKLYTAVAAAQSGQAQLGYLHDSMEKALAEKLNLPLATVETEFNAGKTMPQIALGHGIAQADLNAFMLEVRTRALEVALADGVITQAQADRMLQSGGRGNGTRMLAAGSGTCAGTGVPVGGSMMQRGWRWQQQSNP
jgi:hypothetical protein